MDTVSAIMLILAGGCIVGLVILMMYGMLIEWLVKRRRKR